VATFGVGGELILQHHLGKKSSLKGLGTIFIEAAKDEMLPYFIEATRIKSDDEIYVKLEDLHTKEAARPFVRKEIWLEESEFQKYAGKSAPITV
jgi:16S rRNA processing protein RimM